MVHLMFCKITIQALQEFIQPHIESFNYVLDNGIKTAAQVFYKTFLKLFC